jgi:hypothetical protein
MITHKWSSRVINRMRVEDDLEDNLLRPAQADDGLKGHAGQARRRAAAGLAQQELARMAGIPARNYRDPAITLSGIHNTRSRNWRNGWAAAGSKPFTASPDAAHHLMSYFHSPQPRGLLLDDRRRVELVITEGFDDDPPLDWNPVRCRATQRECRL